MITNILEEELRELRQKSLYRKLRTLEQNDGTHAYWDGKKVLLFCGNDYLGLSQHPRVLEAAKLVMERHGIGSGAARLISGTSEYHSKLESKIAALKGKEKSLLFSAGYLANVGILSAIAGAEDVIVMDKLCHASLIDGARFSGAEIRVFPHKNYGRCEEILSKSTSFRKKILVSETVFSMDGDIADLAALTKIKKEQDAFLVLDDAHGTGVLGLNGRGACEDGSFAKDADILVGTLSKALGCLGGFAAASSTVIDYLINHARTFIFATSLPPALCAAAAEAITVLDEEPEIRHRLWRNIQILHGGLQKLGFEMGPIQSPIFPIIIGQEEKAMSASEHLLLKGILVPAIRTPTVPKGKARLRVTISAAHQEQDIETLLNALRQLS